jgi:Helix-turn-helix domain
MTAPSTADLAHPSDRVDKYEAAAILHCDPRTIVDMARTGRLPSAAKLTREWSFDAAALRDYVRRKEIEACRHAQRPPADAIGVGRRSMPASRLAVKTSDGLFKRTIRELRENAARRAKRSL